MSIKKARLNPAYKAYTLCVEVSYLLQIFDF